MTNRANLVFCSLCAAWLVVLAAIAMTDLGRSFLIAMHRERVGSIAFGLFLLMLTGISSVVYHYRLSHALAACWVFAQAIIYRTEVFDGLPHERLWVANGFLITAALPLFVWIGVRTRRVDRERIYLFVALERCIQQQKQPEALDVLRRLGNRIGINGD